MQTRAEEKSPSPGLLDHVRGKNELFIVQDSETFTRNDIYQRAVDLGRRIADLSPCRIALATARADVLIPALCAAQAEGSDLVVLRDTYPPDSPVWDRWKVSVVLDEDLSILSSRELRKEDNQPGILLATSGTTGAPKVALHSLESLLGRVRPSPAPQLRWMLTYHPGTFAGFQMVLTTLTTGGVMISSSSLFAADLAGLAVTHKATHISGTPTFWRGFLMALDGRYNEVPLKRITLGGEAVDQGTLDQLRQAFPHAGIAHIYGSTEVGNLFSVRDGREGFPAEWLEKGPEPGIELRIRDGVLQVKSTRAMKGYIGVSRSELITDDGFTVTGDQVELVGDRVLFRGRVDSIINVGGRKANPEEVEAVLLQVPEVKEARVYGMKNPMVGAIVAADVVVSGDLEEAEIQKHIYAHCSEHLDSFKVPRVIKIVPRIETNVVGKKVRHDNPS